ncbi:hypothetical protein QTP88_022607 [Uroleucon formosanum]
MFHAGTTRSRYAKHVDYHCYLASYNGCRIQSSVSIRCTMRITLIVTIYIMYNAYKKNRLTRNLYQSIHYNFMTKNCTTIYRVKLLNTALFDSTELRADIL